MLRALLDTPSIKFSFSF